MSLFGKPPGTRLTVQWKLLTLFIAGLAFVIGLQLGWRSSRIWGGLPIPNQFQVESGPELDSVSIAPSIYQSPNLQCLADLNGDSRVNVLDLLKVLNNWGQCPATPLPTPTCQPRPRCLDSEPRCMIAEPAEGWCPTTKCLERPTCMDQNPPCDVAAPPEGVEYCPQGCRYQEVQCIQAPCDPVLVCDGPAKLGEVCAGKAQIQCGAGLRCKLDPNQPLCDCVDCECAYPKGVCVATEPAKEGQVCAGSSRIACATGLECVVDPTQPICACINCDCAIPKGVCKIPTVAKAGQPCGGSTGAQCGPKLYCEHSTGSNGQTDSSLSGVCRPVPTNCPLADNGQVVCPIYAMASCPPNSISVSQGYSPCGCPLPPICKLLPTPRSTPRSTPLSRERDGCQIGGCSSQICFDPQTNPGGGVSTCEWRSEYGCYSSAICGRNTSGQCQWRLTTALRACLANPI